MAEIRIRMEEQSRDFALNKQRPVKGELLINEKEIWFNAQNIHGSGKEYKLLFIGRKNGNSVYKIMGDIIPDKNGNAELKCEINPQNVDGEGTELSCFYIFMVAAMGKPLKPVLKGDYIKPPATAKNFNEYYREYILEKILLLKSDGKDTKDVSPFDDEWLVPRWKRITDVMKLPLASTGAEMQILKYGHFLYGTNDELLFLAVPGRKNREEQPDGGKSGFLVWKPIRGSEEYGYWVAVIDCKTGIITEIS